MAAREETDDDEFKQFLLADDDFLCLVPHFFKDVLNGLTVFHRFYAKYPVGAASNLTHLYARCIRLMLVFS